MDRLEEWRYWEHVVLHFKVLVTHIEHLRERQELGILMLASNLAHLIKIPFVLYVAADVESVKKPIAL